MTSNSILPGPGVYVQAAGPNMIHSGVTLLDIAYMLRLQDQPQHKILCSVLPFKRKFPQKPCDDSSDGLCVQAEEPDALRPDVTNTVRLHK